MYEAASCLVYLSNIDRKTNLCIMKQGREDEATETIICLLQRGTAEGAKRPRSFYAFSQKKVFIPGCVKGASI